MFTKILRFPRIRKSIHKRKFFHEFIPPKKTSLEVNNELLKTIVSGDAEGCLAYLEYYKELVDFSRKSNNGNRIIDWTLQSANPNYPGHNVKGQYLQIVVYLLLQGMIAKQIPDERLVISEQSREKSLKLFVNFVDDFPAILQKAKYLDYANLPEEVDIPLILYAYNLIHIWHKPKIFERIQINNLMNNSKDELLVLSLGCGTIDEFIPLSNILPKIKYIGVDKDEFSIELSRKIYKNFPIQPNLKVGDVAKMENLTKLGLNRNSFDLIIISHPNFGPDEGIAFTQMIKQTVPYLLKKDGAFIATNYFREEFEFMKTQISDLYPYSASYSNINNHFQFLGADINETQACDNFIFVGANEEKPTLTKTSDTRLNLSKKTF